MLGGWNGVRSGARERRARATVAGEVGARDGDGRHSWTGGADGAQGVKGADFGADRGRTGERPGGQVDEVDSLAAAAAGGRGRCRGEG